MWSLVLQSCGLKTGMIITPHHSDKHFMGKTEIVEMIFTILFWTINDSQTQVTPLSIQNCRPSNNIGWWFLSLSVKTLPLWSFQPLSIEHQTDRETLGSSGSFFPHFKIRDLDRGSSSSLSTLLLDDAQEDQDVWYTPHIRYPCQSPYPYPSYPSSDCIC